MNYFTNVIYGGLYPSALAFLTHSAFGFREEAFCWIGFVIVLLFPSCSVFTPLAVWWWPLGPQFRTKSLKCDSGSQPWGDTDPPPHEGAAFPSTWLSKAPCPPASLHLGWPLPVASGSLQQGCHAQVLVKHEDPNSTHWL